MTQTSLDNYKSNLLYYHAEYGDMITNDLIKGKCDIFCKLYNHRIATAFIYKIMLCYELYDESSYTGPIGTGIGSWSGAPLPYGSFTVLVSDFIYTPLVGDTISGIYFDDDTKITGITLGPGPCYVFTIDKAMLSTGRNLPYTVTRTASATNPNCLEREKVQKMVEWLNVLYDTSYCLNFIKE